MKKLLSVCVMIALLCVMAGCGAGASKPAEQASEPEEAAADTAVLSSEAGWSVSYDRALFDVTSEEGGSTFTYKGDAAGDSHLKISRVDGAMPQELLYEKTADWGEEQVRTEGFLVGTEDKWSYTRTLNSEEDGLSVVRQYTAAEYNGGSILFEFVQHMDGDEARNTAVSDALASVIDSIRYENFEPQTELSYVPGTYLQHLTEEYEGETVEVTYSVTLSPDHSGVMSIQDNMDLIWGSYLLYSVTGGYEYEYTVEGDALYINFDGEWSEFRRSLPEYRYPGDDPVAAAVSDYLVNNFASDFAPADLVVPSFTIIATEEPGENQVDVMGDYEITCFEKQGDSLQAVSGGHFPGKVHLEKNGDAYVATGMDVCVDGARYAESAQEIFGEHYETFQKVSADSAARDALLKQAVTDYVKANGLSITEYQFYGAEPVALDLN